MIHRHHDINLGQTPIWVNDSHPSGEFVQLMDETYYRIRHYDQMSPFFMSLVSSADHWLFIASTGGLTIAQVAPILPYLFLVLMLIFRPRGLLGTREG